ncbi:hypothetical protein [Streptomyces peucetius]|uniref:Uncharacterized protein n=1 Tax=Streptomyces peucetius TaxID=1950 RepID=A0ABY6ICP6_STRPE|nr:hypothetical protein [Streptomyces peucetius]UYQ64479.1 hypothetical protein OGH68_25425 [Streptomyces peucetius]
MPEVQSGGRSLLARAAVVLDPHGQVQSLIPKPGHHTSLVLRALAAL